LGTQDAAGRAGLARQGRANGRAVLYDTHYAPSTLGLPIRGLNAYWDQPGHVLCNTAAGGQTWGAPGQVDAADALQHGRLARRLVAAHHDAGHLDVLVGA
jgi:hypothetical protein